MTENSLKLKPPSKERLYHRHVGLLMSLFLVLLTLTGIVINHAADLELDRSHIPSAIAGLFYGSVDSDAIVFAAGDDFFHWSDQQLWLNEHHIGAMAEVPVGAVVLNDELLIASPSEIFLVTADGQLVEQLDSSFLPGEISGVAMADGELVIRSGKNLYSVSSHFTAFANFSGDATFSRALDITPAITAALPQVGRTNTVTWQRFLTDLHTGRLFGALGPFLFDLVALILLTLATTGIVLWLRVRRRQR